MAAYESGMPPLEDSYWPAMDHSTSMTPKTYCMNLTTDSRFFPLLGHMPTSEVEAYRRVTYRHEDCHEVEKSRNDASELDIRMMLVLNRLTNRICDRCWDKTDISSLKWCEMCKLVWYCSEKCQAKAWETHKLWCCQKNGPVDDGPMKTVVVEIK